MHRADITTRQLKNKEATPYPVLRWMAGNVVIETDAAENIKVTKAKSKEKIDGIVASIMALDRCLRNERGSHREAFMMREDC